MDRTVYSDEAVKLLKKAEDKAYCEVRITANRNATIALERIQEAIMWLERR